MWCVLWVREINGYHVYTSARCTGCTREQVGEIECASHGIIAKESSSSRIGPERRGTRLRSTRSLPLRYTFCQHARPHARHLKTVPRHAVSNHHHPRIHPITATSFSTVRLPAPDAVSRARRRTTTRRRTMAQSWESLRKEARRLETEIDAKLVEYSKVAASLHSSSATTRTSFESVHGATEGM